MINHAPLYGLAEFSKVFGDPYHSVTTANDTQTRLIKIDPETGATQIIVSLNAGSNEGISILPPSGWVSPTHDTVLVFLVQGFRNVTQGFVNAYAYCPTKNKFLWKIELTTPHGITTMNAPLVIRDRVVFITAAGLFCVDIPTGTIKWQHTFPNPLKGFNYKPLYVNGRIYQRSGEDVMALDAYSGTILWEYNDKINNLEGGSMAYYKGNLYFTAEDGYDPYYARYLFCLDGATGKLIWKDKGPHEYSGMAFGVIVDPATGYLYATDAFRMMCIDLNNSPKP
ncbi:MAG TPA: PQQ-binding-like beta-propeller repeat protein [Bacteroidales bacterium]|nr:PQQ-binding-like beta-propeller repeat protein [Bacteroidales bacterium]HRZ48438.1 PQQ-binding-like beta-propeller repeat protein [Bacteroidales bacterium]